MDKVGVRAAFEAAGLSRLLKDVDFLAKDSIRLHTKVAGEYDLSIGASRTGGVPDVPPDFKWPERNAMPQSFVAQIYLDEAHPYDTHGALPARGMLWFLRCETGNVWGGSRGSWWLECLFIEDYSGLQRIAAPAKLPAESQFKACTVSFANEVTLSQSPNLTFPILTGQTMKSEIRDAAVDISHFRGSWRCALPVVGNPQTIQDDMRLECQLASHGITDINDPRANELSKGANEWQLLLQVDTDEDIGMQWGNTGMIYYWLKVSDLQKAISMMHG